MLHRTLVEAGPNAGYRQSTARQQPQLFGDPGGINFYMQRNIFRDLRAPLRMAQTAPNNSQQGYFQ